MRVIELANTVKAFELNLTNRYLALGEAGFSDDAERRALQQEYAEITLGKNRLEWISDGADTPKYFPSLYVSFSAERSPIADARIAAAQLHQAFLLGNDVVARNLFIGKYQGNFRSSNGKNLVLSLRGLDCKHTINLDTAIAACRNNGTTHHLTTNAEYAYLALKCKAQGFQPQGNNNYGKDEQGNFGDIVHQYTSGANKVFGRVAQGSGPLTWFHDGSPLGVWGLNGNAYEWSPGYRLMDGKVQVVEYNTAALQATDMSAASAAWKGILIDGTLVDPGTEGELMFGDQNAVGDNVINITGGTWDGTNYFGRPFTSIEYTGFPAILKELAIIPHDAGITAATISISTYRASAARLVAGPGTVARLAGCGSRTSVTLVRTRTATSGCVPLFTNQRHSRGSGLLDSDFLNVWGITMILGGVNEIFPHLAVCFCHFCRIFAKGLVPN